ncbi:MAG: penicillin-binding transpeptidase domain-containing protein [Clostridiales bacterium]|nr:penicillin-binding transpeptidase domain-containing protein [Clostridiales bacterium]
MRQRRRKSYRRRRRNPWKVILPVAGVVVVACGVGAAVKLQPWNYIKENAGETESGEPKPSVSVEGTPSAVMEEYVSLLNQSDYDGMYDLLTSESQDSVSREEFVTRNQNIYEGIGASHIQYEETKDDDRETVAYVMTMDSVAGEISFDHTASFLAEDGEYRLVWNDQMIFPDLEKTDKVRVSTTPAERGSIFDRNGILLAGQGEASSVGLVPGNMTDQSAAKLAKALGMEKDTVKKKLKASWVKDDTFVPIKTIEKLTEQELMEDELSDETKAKQKLMDELLSIDGVMIQDTDVRIYPLGEAAAHLIGYVQSITAEELEKDQEGIYTSTSLIGKTGLESFYEERLRGVGGKKISIVTEDGNVRKVLAVSNPEKGEDITLTIDSELQTALYEEYREDESASAAMNPYNGQVLALVSTPSYNDNAFILGVSQTQWDDWNEAASQPLLNRFRAVWAPGSSFKPITAAIGITGGLLDPDKDYGSYESWQKDASWGKYKVTTLHAADPGTLENALVLSDNVYFARAAVKMGADVMEEAWNGLGFGETLPFDIRMKTSTYSNDEHLTSEIQLADSGYGQGQIQVNPLHLASIYTAFSNEGNMLTPVLEMGKESSLWKEDVFSEEACQRVNQALIKVVSSSKGTAHGAAIDGLSLAGKTGTAEIKASQSDTSGTELGWFAAYTTDLSEDNALLLVTMVEDVKGRGGSGYVVKKNRSIFEDYCLRSE